jgi:hypothetical protein
MLKRLVYVCAVIAALVVPLSTALAAPTTVPGHTSDRTDADGNGYADVGVVVNGHYTSVYAYDASGAYYWDLGDGRIQGTVDSIDDLDQSTLSRCDYVVNYRGTFENDPYQDTGWIQNMIHCSGYDGNATWHYQIVNESDPRYTGNPDWAIWGNWEYHVLTESGTGNLVRPEHNVGS